MNEELTPEVALEHAARLLKLSETSALKGPGPSAEMAKHLRDLAHSWIGVADALKLR